MERNQISALWSIKKDVWENDDRRISTVVYGNVMEELRLSSDIDGNILGCEVTTLIFLFLIVGVTTFVLFCAT